MTPPIIIFFFFFFVQPSIIWQIMWPLFLSLKPQPQPVLGSAWAKRSWLWGLNRLSKQTYQKQTRTGCCKCHIRPVLNQWNHKTYILMGPSSCHTMPTWLNEHWVQLHETPEASWGKAQLCLSHSVSLSNVKTFKWQAKFGKSAMSEISFNLMGQELLSHKVLFFFFNSMDMDVTQI